MTGSVWTVPVGSSLSPERNAGKPRTNSPYSIPTLAAEIPVTPTRYSINSLLLAGRLTTVLPERGTKTRRHTTDTGYLED
ncbi:MAG: hypothetical protein J07HX64_01778 [halophilic archaeon J07HX64]|nr:MAG: hypothetical protein J07HX64_01778 [halophilic archaeon J07HX64]